MPRLIFCGDRPSLHEAHRGLPQWHDLNTICSPWRDQTGEVVVWNIMAAQVDGWLETLTTFGPRWASGPPVDDWPRMSDVYARANVRLREGVLVQVLDERVIRHIPARYALLLDVRRRFAAWELQGRRVWLRGGNLRTQWLTYCEMTVAGVTVEAMLVPPPKRKGLLGADLYYHGLDEDVAAQNTRFLRRYWRGVNAFQAKREETT